MTGRSGAHIITDADKEAAALLLGTWFDAEAARIALHDATVPPNRPPYGSFRNEQSPSRRAPNIGLPLREWNVRSTSNPSIQYTVVERVDTLSPRGRTYFYCNCPSWGTQRGRGQDCKHIREVVE